MPSESTSAEVSISSVPLASLRSIRRRTEMMASGIASRPPSTVKPTRRYCGSSRASRSIMAHQPPLAVPVDDGFIGILAKAAVALALLRQPAPARLRVEKDVLIRRRQRKFRVDRRGERIDPLGPSPVPYPERAAAVRAEMALSAAARRPV